MNPYYIYANTVYYMYVVLYVCNIMFQHDEGYLRT